MRITNKIREEMLNEILRDSGYDRSCLLETECSEYANHVLDVLIGSQNMSTMKLLPSNFFMTVNSTRINYEDKAKDGGRVSKNLLLGAVACNSEIEVTQKNSWSYRYISLGSGRKVPECYEHTAHLYPREDPEHKRLVEIGRGLQSRLEELVDDLVKLKNTAEQALAGVNTQAQLAKAYPDLLKFLPKVEKASKPLAVTNDKVAAAMKCAASEKVSCK